MNIYVGNFDKDVTSDDLKKVFEAYGEVTSATVITDKFTGESRGFGFVEMPSKKAAEEAINATRDIAGKMVVVNEAKPRQDNRSGGGRGGSRRDSRGSNRGGGGRSSW